jgi:hypothetical protein
MLAHTRPTRKNTANSNSFTAIFRQFYFFFWLHVNSGFVTIFKCEVKRTIYALERNLRKVPKNASYGVISADIKTWDLCENFKHLRIILVFVFNTVYVTV